MKELGQSVSAGIKNSLIWQKGRAKCKWSDRKILHGYLPAEKVKSSYVALFISIDAKLTLGMEGTPLWSSQRSTTLAVDLLCFWAMALSTGSTRMCGIFSPQGRSGDPNGENPIRVIPCLWQKRLERKFGSDYRVVHLVVDSILLTRSSEWRSSMRTQYCGRSLNFVLTKWYPRPDGPPFTESVKRVLPKFREWSGEMFCGVAETYAAAEHFNPPFSEPGKDLILRTLCSLVHLVAEHSLLTSNYKSRHSINFLYKSATLPAMSTKDCLWPDWPHCTLLSKIITPKVASVNVFYLHLTTLFTSVPRCWTWRCTRRAGSPASCCTLPWSQSSGARFNWNKLA